MHSLLALSVLAIGWKASLSPSTHSFGTHYDFGEKFTATLTFKNENSKGCFTEFKMQPTAKPFSITGGTCQANAVVAPGGTCTLVLDFVSSTVGNFSETPDLKFRNSRKCTATPSGFSHRLSSTFSATVLAKPPTGSADLSFGNQGISLVDYHAQFDGLISLALDSQGRILGAGYSSGGESNQFSVSRLLTNGGLDSGFGVNGFVPFEKTCQNEQAHHVSTDATGRIYVAGRCNDDFLTTRVLSTGTLDMGFGDRGRARTSIGPNTEEYLNSALGMDSSVVVGGTSFNGNLYQFGLAKYLENGALDSGFGNQGMLALSIGHNHSQLFTLTTGDNGSFYGAGYGANSGSFDFAVAKFLANGSLDKTFGTDGTAFVDFGGSTDIVFNSLGDTEGKILLGGRSRKGDSLFYAIARLNSDGSLDKTFGKGGKLTVLIGTGDDLTGNHSIDPNGRILLATYLHQQGAEHTTELRRLNADGSLDESFGIKGIAATSFRNLRGRGIPMLNTRYTTIVGGFKLNENSNDFAFQRFWSW